jgi:predicted RNase H-like HicB family nuclease
LRYTIEITWSDDDNTYVVILPEWADRRAMPVASGKIYEEAVARGRNALENIVEFSKERGATSPRSPDVRRGLTTSLAGLRGPLPPAPPLALL